jgi:hypothetical protein
VGSGKIVCRLWKREVGKGVTMRRSRVVGKFGGHALVYIILQVIAFDEGGAFFKDLVSPLASIALRRSLA